MNRQSRKQWGHGARVFWSVWSTQTNPRLAHLIAVAVDGEEVGRQIFLDGTGR